VLAIAVGIADGLGLGANTRAAMITRGLAEIARLGAALGAANRNADGSGPASATWCFDARSRSVLTQPAARGHESARRHSTPRAPGWADFAERPRCGLVSSQHQVAEAARPISVSVSAPSAAPRRAISASPTDHFPGGIKPARVGTEAQPVGDADRDGEHVLGRAAVSTPTMSSECSAEPSPSGRRRCVRRRRRRTRPPVTAVAIRTPVSFANAAGNDGHARACAQLLGD